CLCVLTFYVCVTVGTDFAKIENARRKLNVYTYLEFWVQSTVTSFVEAMCFSELFLPSLISSGGIYKPLDIVK
ncbi:type 2 isopentenyl-diphosphate Delta-isomerase, partial [Streptococcus suis]